jgi:hypothetical protein
VASVSDLHFEARRESRLWLFIIDVTSQFQCCVDAGGDGRRNSARNKAI